MLLVIGNKNYSSWSLRPWLLLEHFGLAFNEVIIPLYQADSAEQIRHYSLAAKVPVLVDQDRHIWDSLAICEYVSEQYLAGRAWPTDITARAHARSVSAEMHSGFTALRQMMPMNCRASGRHIVLSVALEKDIQRISAIWSECRERYAAQGPWLFGEFSIADCMFAPVVWRFATYSVNVSPICQTYMTTMQNSQAMQKWLGAAVQEKWQIAESEVGN
jgi:glutathione S-transferase